MDGEKNGKVEQCGVVLPEQINSFRSVVTLTKRAPLAGNDPLLTAPPERCAACQQFLKAGDEIALVPLGPGDGKESRAKAAANQPYTAIAVPVHWSCATGLP